MQSDKKNNKNHLEESSSSESYDSSRMISELEKVDDDLKMMKEKREKRKSKRIHEDL
jgi:hypothetical protein